MNARRNFACLTALEWRFLAAAEEGLIGACGRLYLSTQDGKMICFEPTEGERR